MGRKFVAHLHPAGAYAPIRNVPVECVFDCQGTGERLFAPQVVDHGRGQKLSIWRNFKKFFHGLLLRAFIIGISENKKGPATAMVTGSQSSVYGINGNKLRQKDSK